MSPNIEILQLQQIRAYHSVPSRLSKITISPEREAIFKHMARISPSKFPEFVADILVSVEGHKLIDITDGPGDEKQDILSLRPSGERYLTQCKHTIRYEDKSTGDDLDLLLAACLRKKCTNALYVTNADLTPQAKRYVTDNEYSRGWNASSAPPRIDYWNAARIWERIATYNDILNKWFSGMSQAHGLRQFTFHIMIESLPDGETTHLSEEEVIEKLSQKVVNNIIQEDRIIVVDTTLSFRIQGSFRSDTGLDVPYVGPERYDGMINVPLRALEITAIVSNSVGQYQTSEYRDKIVQIITDNLLPDLGPDKWWHIIATRPRAFVFFQDIVQAKVVSISDPETYVRVGNCKTTKELEWICPVLDDFSRVTEDDERELRWIHTPSKTQVMILVSQKPHPVKAYEHQVFQQMHLRNIAEYSFFAVTDADPEALEKIRRLLSHRCVLLKSDRNDLFIGLPKEHAKAEIGRVIEMLRRMGIEILRVKEEDKNRILEGLQDTLREPGWELCSNQDSLVTPIWLNERIIWLWREHHALMPNELDRWVELVRFKAEYEARHGYDFMHDQEKITMASEEIRGFLYDVLSVRGKRMLDIRFNDEVIHVSLRGRERTLRSTSSVLPEYIAELDALVSQIVKTYCGKHNN